MENAVTCPICLLDVKDKYMTSCGHIFCTECIIGLHQFHGWSFSCPICRESLHITRSQIEIPPFDPKNYPLDCQLKIPELLSAYITITREQKWELLHDFIVDENRGFMNTDNRSICDLMHKINDDYNGGHSGTSMGFTMRAMHYISKFGLRKYERVMGAKVDKISRL